MNKTSTIALAGKLFLAAGLAFQLAGCNFFENRSNAIYFPPDDAGSRDLLATPGLSWETIPQHYARSKGVDDWQKLQSPRQWREGYSAFELAHSWESANPELPDEINALFGGSTELLAAIPEHKTPLPGGSAPSQSDVLAFVRMNGKVCAVAVEGKADEQFGPTVGAWLKNASPGKVERLRYVSGKLGLSYPPADNIRYQLLHRAASAVIEAERFNADCAAVVIHSFAGAANSFRDFGVFLGAFGIRQSGNDELYTSEKSSVPLSFGWTFPSRVGIAPTKETDSNLLFYIYVAIILVALIVVWPIIKNRNNNVEGEIENGEQTSKEKGDDFQDYVIDKFNMLKNHERNNPNLDKNKRFELIDDRSDRNRNNVSAKSNQYPDFEIGFWLGGQKKFAVECKWRSAWVGLFSKKVKIDEYKIRNYKEYQNERELKTFIVLGIGGRPNNPESMFIIDLDDIKISNEKTKSNQYREFTFDELKQYRQPAEQKFFYYYHKDRTLKFM